MLQKLHTLLLVVTIVLCATVLQAQENDSYAGGYIGRYTFPDLLYRFDNDVKIHPPSTSGKSYSAEFGHLFFGGHLRTGLRFSRDQAVSGGHAEFLTQSATEDAAQNGAMLVGAFGKSTFTIKEVAFIVGDEFPIKKGVSLLVDGGVGRGTFASIFHGSATLNIPGIPLSISQPADDHSAYRIWSPVIDVGLKMPIIKHRLALVVAGNFNAGYVIHAGLETKFSMGRVGNAFRKFF
jgi:hypothetical protein